MQLNKVTSVQRQVQALTKTLFTFTSALLLSGAAPSDMTSVRRDDLTREFSTLVCEGNMGSLPQIAWNLGVYDAQLEGQFLSRIGLKKLDPAMVAQRAQTMAVMQRAGGYAYGLCDHGRRGWIMALPAPAPIMSLSANTLQLPSAALADRCQSFRIDFAGTKDFFPRQLQANNGRLNIDGLGDGVISLTCQPKAPHWQGPVLWFLYPVGKQSPGAIPVADALTATDDLNSLHRWVNKIREMAHLAPLASNAALNDAADKLAVDRSLTHNRTLLKGAAKLLCDLDINMLSEDRIKGPNLQTIAWLLWHSPRHRESRLRRDATMLGLSSAGPGHDQIIVLVTGSNASIDTAKKKPAHSSAASQL
jgi:hypothetical protein